MQHWRRVTACNDARNQAFALTPQWPRDSLFVLRCSFLKLMISKLTEQIWGSRPLRDIFGLVTNMKCTFFLCFIVGLNRPKSPSLIEKNLAFFHPLPGAPNCCWKNRLHPAAVALFQKQIISSLVGPWNPGPPAVTLQWREDNAC